MKYLSLILCLACTACVQKERHEESISTTYKEKIVEPEPIYVTCKEVKKEAFGEELESNGTLEAIRKADLIWEINGNVSNVYVQNGQKVTQGQVLAELDKSDLEDEKQQAINTKEKAYIDYQDYLIGQGYNIQEIENIPEKIAQIGKIRSGYQHAEYTYKLIQKQLEKARIRAPFDGLLANINAAPGQKINSGTSFGLLLDTHNMTVSFPILEQEMEFIKKGRDISVFLSTNKQSTAKGFILSINPIVNDKGMIFIKATIPNPPSNWYEGMKVGILIHKIKEPKIVVPKNAVVLRDGKHVVFTYKHGRADWNYVTLGAEHSSSYVIEKGLEIGDSIIVSNTTYLAHFTPVILKK